VRSGGDERQTEEEPDMGKRVGDHQNEPRQRPVKVAGGGRQLPAGLPSATTAATSVATRRGRAALGMIAGGIVLLVVLGAVLLLGTSTSNTNPQPPGPTPIPLNIGQGLPIR
jgi:hypothetical protein